MRTWIVLGLTCLLSFQLIASERVIYGEDDRQDIYDLKDERIVELARSTAGMIPSGSLKDMRNGKYKISDQTLEQRKFCSQEKFFKQVTAANCSGFIVGKDILVTAGHCVRSGYSCKSYKWVFDYKVEREDQTDIYVDKSNVYSCEELIETKVEGSRGLDYAVIRLDREVKGRTPLKFRKESKISIGEDIFVIGHPTGLPTKFADGAQVRSQTSAYFVANLDTYGGNSGSAVFNERTHEVEGILVRGEADYVWDYSNNCRKSNICDDNGCRGEDVTNITAVESIQKLSELTK
jgi:V8-like Glu-specific endopeptidase